MHTRTSQLAILLMVSIFTSKATADCDVVWDSENVVATQLEGSWALNKELSLILTPWSDTLNLEEVK